MGVCASSDRLTPEEKARLKQDKDRSRRLEQQMQAEHTEELQINKLLLLGAGESGKSTLFKQMITIYGTGFPEAERKTFTNIVYNNVITSMKTLCEQSYKYGEISGKAAKSLKIMEELKGDEEIDEVIGKHMKRLWKHPVMQTTYQNRSSFQLTDSAAYFFERLDDIMMDDYLPTQQDVLRTRVRTTGIVENNFAIDGNQFKMYDVGGQRNERKKWIHCFENVTAVLFVAAISEYDQVLYEDENTNRMTEALNLFEEICNSRWFRETAMILFLNKRDLFEEKIKKVSLRVCFPEYQGEDNFEEGTTYIKEQFESRNRNPDKMVYTHVTCATDTMNITVVFNAVKDIIIKRSLTEAGLV